jgi:hypothetical protein
MTLLLPSFFASIPFGVNRSGAAIKSIKPIIVPWGHSENVTSIGLGLSTVKVFAVHIPLHLIGPPPYPNNTYWAVGIQVCAGPNGANIGQYGIAFYALVHTSHGDETIPSEYDLNSRFKVLTSVNLKPHECEPTYVESREFTSLHPIPMEIQIEQYYFKLTK